MIAQTIISALIGYAFGCIQAAFIISRLAGGMDIRDHGSGNAGASNVTTIMGLRYGVIVGVVDILKGVLAVLVVKWLYPAEPNLAFLSGLMAIVGHIYPFYMKFRGGKGVAALVGMMFGLDWKLGLIFVLLVAVPALLSDYIVAGSFTAFIGLPVAAYLLGYPLILVLFGLFLTGLCFYLHRGNIQRIINKDEVKIRSVIGKR
jgi:glycerol-3-phosphate acyltransferase PlsY